MKLHLESQERKIEQMKEEHTDELKVRYPNKDFAERQRKTGSGDPQASSKHYETSHGSERVWRILARRRSVTKEKEYGLCAGRS